MVSVTIGLLLTAGIGSYLVASQRTTEATNHMGEMQERARVALMLISNDLKMVGFWGDFTGSTLVDGGDLTIVSSMSTDCGVRLADGSLLGTFPSTDSVFLPVWAEQASDSDDVTSGFECVESTERTLVAGSDVVSLKRLMGNPDPVLDASRHYFAANTQMAEIFPGDQLAPSEAIMPERQVWEYQHYIYFVDEESGVPSLRRYYLTNKGSGVGVISGSDEGPLVEGIQFMRILFGVDTSDVADGIIDSTLSSDDVDYQYWSEGRVLGAKIYLLVRSLTEDASFSNSADYVMGDITINGGDDHYRRMLVENIVSFRNLALSLDTNL
jgi:type IV pilus assembly protein PilW